MIDQAVGEVVWITGGSGGIGLACALEVGKSGRRVALSGRSVEKLHVAAKTLESHGVTVFLAPGDLANERAVNQAHTQIVEYFGERVSILIQCAGTGSFEDFSKTSLVEFDTMIASNLRSNFLCAKAVLPGMSEAKHGAIVNVLSIASIKAFRGGAAYVASKFALHGFTNALREEARKHGVKVIGIFPGATETALWSPMARTEFHERMMQPEDIAQAVMAALAQPQRALMEEILLRPIGGDL
ncbi:MAG: SDR family oxidoreductase [Candidatus Kapaibacterium sp.]